MGIKAITQFFNIEREPEQQGMKFKKIHCFSSNGFRFAFAQFDFSESIKQKYKEKAKKYRNDFKTEEEEDRKEAFHLEIYVDGNRSQKLSYVTEFGYDDQDIFFSRYENKNMDKEEFKEYLTELKKNNITLTPQEAAKKIMTRKEVFYEISQEQGPKIKWEFADVMETPDEPLRYAIKNSFLAYGCFFTSLKLIGSSIFVAHDTIVSRYCLIENAWKQHMRFPDTIEFMSRIEQDDEDENARISTTEDIITEEDENNEDDKKKDFNKKKLMKRELAVCCSNHIVYHKIVQ